VRQFSFPFKITAARCQNAVDTKDETKPASKSGEMELTSFHPPSSESENGKVKILQARS
jgi:hypothetical protein